jgi:transposase-like protein
MTPEIKVNEPSPVSQDEFHDLIAEKMRAAVRLTLVAIMNEEVTAFVGAPYGEPSATRRDYRNGYYPRDLVTTVGKLEDLPVPRTRGGFRTQVFDQYQRRQRELDVAIGEMFVKGISTAGVGQVMTTLTGQSVSPSTVSRVHHGLEAEYAQWQRRALAERYAYVFADGTYFSVIYGDDETGREAHKTPILA